MRPTGKIHEGKQTRRKTGPDARRARGRSESRSSSDRACDPGPGAAACRCQRPGTAARAFANQRTRAWTTAEVRNRSGIACDIAREGRAIAGFGLATCRRALALRRRSATGSVARASAQWNDLDHFFRSREPLGDFHRAGNAQRLHAFLVSELADLGIVRLLVDQMPQRRGKGHDFVKP